jgi:predicted house-cleaning noncanonical NTP pyrophosphatase (MazG superfamily)
MSQKIRNTEACEVSQDRCEEQVRTLLEIVTEIYNALEKEKRVVARDPQPAAGSLGRPVSRREEAP